MATANRTEGTGAPPVAEEIRYKGEESEHIAMTMQTPLASPKTTRSTISRLVSSTTESFLLPGNATVDNQNYTLQAELSVNETSAHLAIANHSWSYANNSRSPFITRVSVSKAVGGCCPIDNFTSVNSTGTGQNNSDDALGPVIGGLCTAVGLLLCLWLVCFAIEKRIHSRKRAVERHYLPQSRSYPIQVAEMRKALRQHWDTARSSRRSYPWSSKRSSRQASLSEPNCIVVGRQYGGISTPSITVTSAAPEPPSLNPEGEVKVEPTSNGFPGAPTMRLCKSAPAMTAPSFQVNHSASSASCSMDASEDDNLSATTSGDLSEESGDNNIDCKPTRMFLSVGDPYTYTPGGVFVEEAESPAVQNEARVGGQEMKGKGKSGGDDKGATEKNDKRQTPNAGSFLSPEMPGLRNQLEIDESQCLTR